MKTAAPHPLFLSVAFVLLAGCAGSRGPVARTTSSPLSADNINLVLVVSEDLENSASGDVDPTTENLTSQGLHRSLMMAPFLKKHVFGNNTVTVIYALEPRSHLQTADLFPDMAAPKTIQQFAVLNTETLQFNPVGSTLNTVNSFSKKEKL